LFIFKANNNEKQIRQQEGGLRGYYFFFLKIFFGVPNSATFIFDTFVYVIAIIAYIHPVYGAGVRTHNLLIMSHLPLPLDHGSHLGLRGYSRKGQERNVAS
jgi:hypothetical protein